MTLQKTLATALIAAMMFAAAGIVYHHLTGRAVRVCVPPGICISLPSLSPPQFPLAKPGGLFHALKL